MARQEGPRGFEIRGEAKKDESAGTPDASGEFTFPSLVLSLSTSALMHLGVAPRGEDDPPKEQPVNLPAARQVIDILEMLHEKTRGNLDEEESRLLEQALHDLQMRFVETKRRA